MYRHRAGNIKLVVLLAGVIACSGAEEERADTSSAGPAGSALAVSGPTPAGGDLLWRNDAFRELDGDDENAERLVATVSTGPLDSMVVRFEVRTSKDGLLYSHQWPAIAYMKYDPRGSAKDSAAVLRETERQMGRIFQDSSFILGSAAAAYAGKDGVDLDAIRFDIGEHEYRKARSLKRRDPLPPRAYDEINALARAVPLTRVQAVAAETRNMAAFKYYAGGEETYVIAWSASEGRMVRIAACC